MHWWGSGLITILHYGSSIAPAPSGEDFIQTETSINIETETSLDLLTEN